MVPKSPTDAAIDRAIASAAAREHAAEMLPEPPREMAQYTLNLHSGKPAMVAVTPDMTDFDWLDLITIILAQVRPAHVAGLAKDAPPAPEARKGPRLLIPR